MGEHVAREPKEALEAFRVPGYGNWYTIGFGQSKVTIRTQQIRALNLAWALHHERKITDGPVVVVGAGAAGLSVAAGLAHWGAKVTVLEKAAYPLPLQRHCYKRHIHPNVFDWPDLNAENAFAELPLLNWKAGVAREVAISIEAAFDALAFEYAPRLTLQVGAADIEIDSPAAGLLSFRKDKKLSKLSYATLIFALGFGVENSFWKGPRGSYWCDDDLDQHGVFQAGKYLVSGVGDGGLIDTLRIVTSGLRQEDFARLVPTGKRFDKLREELIQLETDAMKASPDVRGQVMFDAYERLDGDAVELVDSRLAQRLNRGVHVTLLSRGASPFTVNSRPLHRFLLSRLLFTQADLINVRTQCELTEGSVRRDGHEVILQRGTEQRFDHAVIRHGTTSAVQQFPALATALTTFIPTKIGHAPLYQSGEFSGSSSEGGPIAWAGGPSEEDYLDALRRKCAFIRRIGRSPIDSEALGNIYYEVRAAELREPYRSFDSRDGLLTEVEAAARPWADPARQALEQDRREIAAVRVERERRRAPGMALRPADHRVEGVQLFSGRPGTGKTTFIKLLVRQHLEARREDERRPFPIWVSGVLDTATSVSPQIAISIVEAALRSVELASFSRAASFLLARLERKEAVVFLDAVDAWEPELVSTVVRWMREHRIPVVLSARRFSRPVSVLDSSEIRSYELVGISPRSSKLFAEVSLGNAAAAEATISSLTAIPNASEWLANPFLLSLAIGLEHSQGIAGSATSIWDLFHKAMAPSSSLKGEGRERALDLVRGFAQLDLRRDPPRLFFPRERIPFELRRAVHDAGLVSGDRLLEFAHLSIGEYLASQQPLETASERLALVGTGAELSWRHQLEILAMAHAGDGREIRATFEECRAGDPRHLLLGLLLRAVAYGSPDGIAFCSTSKSDVLAEVVRRLTHPSARFGEDERALLGAMRRAGPFLRGGRLPGSVPKHGEPGAEAWAIGAQIGAGSLDRPTSSHWWATTFHQALALLDLEPAEVWRRTRGGDFTERSTALVALGDEKRRHELLAQPGDPRLTGAFRQVTRPSLPLLGALAHDSGFARMWAIRVWPQTFWAQIGLQAVLESMLRFDPDDSVRAAAVRQLPAGAVQDDMVAQFERVTQPRTSIGWQSVELASAIVEKLFSIEAARGVLGEAIRTGRLWFLPREGWALLVQSDYFVTQLRERLESGSANAKEIYAAKGVEVLLDSVRRLIEQYMGEAPHAWQLAACFGALPSNDLPTREARIKCLEPNGFGEEWSSQDKQVVSKAAIATFKGDPDAESLLSGFLTIASDQERSCAALEAIGGVQGVRSLVWRLAKEGEHNTRMRAVEALGDCPEESLALEEYLRDLSKRPRSLGDYFRAQLVSVLAKRREPAWLLPFIEDPSAEVRAEAIKLVIDLPEAAPLLRTRVFLEEGKAQERLWTRFASEPAVRAELEIRAREDQWQIRQAYFFLSMERPETSQKIRKFLATSAADRNMDAVVPELIRALVRDEASLPELRDLISHLNSDIVEALLNTMPLDSELRSRARDKLASDVTWIARFVFFGSDAVRRYFAGDMIAQRTVLQEYGAEMDGEKSPLLVSILRGYDAAAELLRELLSHADLNVVWAAERALLHEGDVRARLVAKLEGEDPSARREAARALFEADQEYRRLAAGFGDSDKEVRLIACKSLKRLGRAVPDAASVLQQEEDADVRKAALETLLDHPSGERLEVLRNCLMRDFNYEIRSIAARGLSRGDNASPLRGMDRIRQMSLAAVSSSSSLARFLLEPQPLTDKESLFGEVLAWVVAKLVSSLPDSDEEFEISRFIDPLDVLVGETVDGGLESPTILIRIAADASRLPRDRNIWPSLNLVVAWQVAQHLRSSSPRTVGLLCGDVGFDEFRVPAMAPGQLRVGPTFFGFGLPLDA